MIGQRPPGYEGWWEARFPNYGLRQQFLDLVNLWNRQEDLPGIEARPLTNKVGVRFQCNAELGLARIIEALGGTLAPPPAVSQLSPDCGLRIR